MKKIILFFLFIGITTISSQAQLKYLSDGKLYLGNVTPLNNYAVQFEAWGYYLTSGNEFLEFKVSGANPRIAGTGNQVVFYNSETSTFNNIKVNTVYNESDSAAKTNIAPLTINQGIQTVMKLKPVSFDWKNPPGYLLKNNPQALKPKRNIGFIAQDVEKVLPQLVVTTDSSGNKMLNYIGIIPVLTKAIQQLNTQVKTLKAEVTALKETQKQLSPN